MKEKREESPPGARVSKRPEDWTAEEKLKVVAEAVGLDDAELGVLLRREGLEQLFRHYDELDEEILAELPLKRIWSVTVQDDA